MPEQTDTNQKNKPSSGKQRRLPKISRRIVIGVGIGLVVIAVLAFAGAKILQKDPNRLGKVGDHIVTKDEVRKLQEGVQLAGFYPESQDQLRDLAMDYQLYIMVAKEYNLEVNEEEALNHLKALTSHIKPSPQLDINNQYVQYRAYKDFLESKLPILMQSQQSGRFIVAHFDNNFDKTLNTLRDLSDEEHKAIMDKDKKYATDFINKVYDDIKSGGITFTQAMERQRKDAKVGEKALPASFHSQAFNKASTDSTQPSNVTITNNPEIYEEMKDLKAGEMTEPFIYKARQGLASDSPLVDTSWMIVRVDEVNGVGKQFSNLLEGLQYFKQKLGYEIYN